MNKTISAGIYKAVFAFLLVTVGFIAQANAQALTAILDKVEAHRKALVSLRSNIKMGQYNPSLSEWTTSNGKVMLVPKNSSVKDSLLRIDWTSPREEILTVIKGNYQAYTPALNQAIRGTASSNNSKVKGNNAFSFLTMSKAELNANYKGEVVGEESLEGGVPTWHVKFIPKTASKYKSADIWVDGNGMILQVKIIPTSGDETYILLSSLEKNVKLDLKSFTVNPPAGTKIVKG